MPSLEAAREQELEIGAVPSSGVHINLFKDAQCIEVWSVHDTFAFLSQIGAVPQLREMR